MFAAENASRVVERYNHKLLQILVGDSLLEPFWPTGSGCARGFLSSLDACWAVKNWGSGQASVLEVLAERESIYRLLAQTTPENLQRDTASYTLDPCTRYTNLNTRCVTPVQVRSNFDTDNPDSLTQLTTAVIHDMPKKRRRKVKDSQVHPDTLLHWLKKQVALYDGVRVEDMEGSFRNGMVLCAVIHRYRPDLVDFHVLDPNSVAANNQLAFDILERELGISPVMTGQEMAECKVPDKLTMLSYLSQIYDTFRGEIPHIKHPRLEPEHAPTTPQKVLLLRQCSKEQAVNLVGRMVHPRTSAGRKRASMDREPDLAVSPAVRPPDTLRRQRKRRSMDRERLTASDRQWILDEIDRNREERMMRKRYMRHLANQQFFKSMQMLQTNDRADPEPFEDYSLFVYRQTAPAFEDRGKDMEKKILYPGREARLRAEIAEIRKGGVDEDLSGRIKILEEKLKGTPVTEKKPRDLYRAIGKIEKSDWNVKEIEKKIQENKMGRTAKHDRTEKVPKWSREQFDDKFQAVKMKLQTKNSDFNPSDKHADVDVALKRVDKKLKESSAMDVGPKVSAMAEQFAVKTQEPEKPSLQRSNSKAAMFVPAQGSSETCHFCNKRVYLMERMSTEGKFFHRGCFRCEYCNTALRLGNYAFDRDGSYGSRFFCTQHFGMKGVQWNRVRRKSEELKSGVDKENIPADTSSKTPAKAKSLCDDVPDKSGELAGVDIMTTPERIEFENLSGAALDVEEAPSEMDEDEWTDRNFGASAAEGSSHSSSSDLSDTEDEEEEANEVFEEAIDQPVPVTVDATRQLAETWSRRYSGKNNADQKEKEGGDQAKGKEEKKDEDDEDSDSFEFEDSDGDNSYHEYDSGDESETATGDEDEASRKLRGQEVRLKVPQLPRGWRDADSGSDTEIVSESTSAESESEEVENSATEIETDSEFEHDGTTPTHEIPAILIDDSNVTRRMHQVIEAPKKVQVRSGHILRPINGTLVTKPSSPQLKQTQDGVKLKFSPLRPEEDNKSSSLSNLTVGNNIINMSNKPPTRTPLINPRPGDYLLNRTHSTEGIASKLSLELKKKYLLGATGFPGSVKKSGSATTLDSKVKNFVDMISEHQKLLHPAPEPSPTMQAFLQGTSKLSITNKPLSPPSPTLLDSPLKLPLPPLQHSPLVKKEKALPLDGDVFEHVCKLGGKQDVPSDVNKKQPHEINGTTFSNGTVLANANKTLDTGQVEVETAVVNQDTSKFEIKDHEEEADCRPRSPVHETSIIVPDIPWKKSRTEAIEDEDIESDSLSSSDSLSNLDDDSDNHRSDSLHLDERMPPRVEIHDSSGTLMLEGTGEQEKGAMVAKQYLAEKMGPFTLELSSPVESVITEDVCKEHKQSTVTSDRSSPSTPPSLRGEDSESVHNEATLAETELSDWAQDGDAIVSEDLEDVEFNIDPHFITTRRHRNLRKGGKVLGARIAQAEEEFGDFDDPGHVCSLYKDVTSSNATSQLLSNTDSIEYMDTGPEEDSSTDDVFAATNESLLKNKGYIQFVNSFDDEDISTPLIEVQNAPTVATAVPAVVVTESVKDGEDTSESPDTVEVSNVEAMVVVSAGELEGNTTEDTTTSGEVVTVKDSPLDNETFYTPVSQSSRDVETASSQEYEEYVKRLQGRISPFSNVRDSIDVRKSRRKNKPPAQLPGLIAEELAEDSSKQYAVLSENGEHVSVSPSSTSQKLVEISRERSKQKDLIHEMVLNKVLTQKKNPYEKKPKRCRSVSSPLTSPGPTSPVKSFFETVPTLPRAEGNVDAKKVETQADDENETDSLNVHKDLEVPLADSLVDEDLEKFYTPVTSFKTKLPLTHPRQRPLSVHASFTGGQQTDNSPGKLSILPDTPLTNPEAFSLPDIRRALFRCTESATEMPVPPPRMRHDDSKKPTNRDRLYEEARKRARLKSDEELGLSPEDYVISLREKVKSSTTGKRVERCLSEPGDSPPSQDQDAAAEEATTKSFPVEAMQRKATSSSKLNDSPQAVAASSSHLTPSATFYVDQDVTMDSQGKKRKDRDRRKSIIQAVSDFFHKKRDSPSSSSPPKTPATTKEKFSKFKFSKGKDKGKSPYSSWSEDSDSDKSLPRRAPEVGQPVRSRSGDLCRPGGHPEVEPPPVPPPPANYEGDAPLTPSRMSEDSLSDAEEDSRATTLSASVHDGGTGTAGRKQARLNRRAARQAHLKRLRMAQEIQRQLEEVEVKQRQLEQRGVCVEKALRGEGTDVEDGCEESDLLREWFDLMRERSELRRFERELLVRAEEIELEDRHARLQQELRDRMSIDDSGKTSEDVAKEGQILKEMLEIVERRDSLILLLEEDRKRYKEEDRDLEAQMLAKGVRLTPLRKESHV